MGLGGGKLSRLKKSLITAAEKARAAVQVHRQAEREWFSTLPKALASDLQVDQGEFSVMQELQLTKLQAVMVLVLQVLPQVQAQHCVLAIV